ncbi:MAG: ferrous iron transport protein B [Nitrospirae bacterium]|nr:ferrous iron transport protein B [Nitrospirota bacterium]
MQKRDLLIALAGQPNVGKSTVFNLLTGLSQHVGNWPGKTVEKKEGFYHADNTRIKVVDLPGSYSLTAYSEEEKVARDFIINERPDAIVLIANASSLERSLYLLSEFLLLKSPIIVALNMMDVAEQQGIRIDVNLLEKYLGIPVIPMVASKNKGIKALISTILLLSEGKKEYKPSMADVTEDHKEIFTELINILERYVTPSYLTKWTVTKIMEGDPDVTENMSRIVDPDSWNKAQAILREHEDSLLAVVHGRYDWIEGAIRSCVLEFKRGQILLTDRLDHILTRPLLGIPILLCILAVVFLLTYGLGLPLQQLLESFMNSIAMHVEPLLGQSFWLRGIIVDGLLGGAGTVLTFLPVLLFFFTAMAFLEDVGYMARAAFVMDRFMHVIGLHGKSFLPFCLGFGCNVPAVMGARILESGKIRFLTIFLTPFVPCTAKLAVVTLISAAIFGKNALLISWALVAGNILILGFSGMIASKFLFKKQYMPFIMELPFYHKPNLRTILMVVWKRIIAFIKKAGTIIVIFSIILWFFSHIPSGDIEGSILGLIGKLIEPVGRPVGLDWKMIVALLASVTAKENSIAALGVLYGVGEEGIREILPDVMSNASALSFLVILMLFVPCVATLVVMKQEMGSWRWFLFSFTFMLIVSYLSGLAVYQFALMIGI